MSQTWLALLLALAFALVIPPAQAQLVASGGNEPNIKAELLAASAAEPGEELLLAIRFEPGPGWHGYWKNPGDAGFGMELDWDLPVGWVAGEPQYPVPQRLLLSGLMNHVYKGGYTVLVPVRLPSTASTTGIVRIGLHAEWLACTDEICVPEEDDLALALPMGAPDFADRRSAEWRSRIAPLIESKATFEVSGEVLRVAIPIPATLELDTLHFFVGVRELGNGLQPAYAAPQRFSRKGDMLVAEVPLDRLVLPPGSRMKLAPMPSEIDGIIAWKDTEGLRFVAERGAVPMGGTLLEGSGATLPQMWVLLAGALLGGLLLNIMPCVFPILSLKALSLARAGESEAQARREGLAYTAGVMLACIALGAAMLALRAAGEQVGWAFQLQEPGVVVALLVLAVAITANLAGVFELPGISLTRSGEPASAFATGLLAAVVATPCTGPFMAAALGAALLLPTVEAIALFAALGLGLALPFLVIGFVPALRRLLPKPGAWMERFRRLMAVPMGLTALALVWLAARLGGKEFALLALAMISGLVLALAVVGRLQRSRKLAWPAFGLIFAPFAIFGAFALPASYALAPPVEAESMLDPVQYSATALAEARASGKPVFIWFTADWCVTCKINERVAIERDATKLAFDRAGVIAMRGDWTRRDAAISVYLAEQGAAGVPLYVWYAPGGEAEILPQVLTPESLIDLARRDSARPAGPGAGSD
ncbi:protein-disulfide reductase DsbD family protein [Parerythrobacter lacustris]|uniref:Protein-disulfide reductase DsbD family protein n=1 Tax=Parerythrobacter lacustris TaxID=2969984 RepID=A0ABT1XNQ1_9SPHN|nr:thioredoxin family protein [Parerythrobacter lacustris]MCR2833202.1 protein-disulfide reductase DsbD family protein [Parerythrobacter lacustris]